MPTKTALPHTHTQIDPHLRELPLQFKNLARIPVLALIRLYQMTISRTLLANTCRFYPTCSHYGYQAIYKYGVLKGGWMATCRVLRCNPFNLGGFDPVPDNLSMNTRKFSLILLLILTGLFTSACVGGSNFGATSWPGITPDGETIYLAFGPHVYAIQASNGQVRWQFPAEPDNKISFYSAPVLTADGQLVAGGYNKVLYSINPQTGRENGWSFEEAGNRYIGSPLATEDGIFAPSTDGNLYALDFQGSQLWTPFHTEQAQWTQPSSDGEKLFLPALDHNLYAINIQNGAEIWSRNLGAAIVGKPTLSSDGVVYIGTFSNKLMALDVDKGTLLWDFDTDGWIWAGTALEGNTLYFGDDSGAIYAVDASRGTQKWKFEADGGIFGTPLVLENTIYFATEAGTVYAISSDSDQLWSHTIGGKIYSGPKSASNLIILGAIEGEPLLTALNREGNPVWSFTPEN